MELTFSDIVDYCRNMSLPEKEELKNLIEKDIIESQREEIYQNCLQVKNEHLSGQSISSDNIDELKKFMNDL